VPLPPTHSVSKDLSPPQFEIESFEASIRQPQLKRLVHSMSAAMPISSQASLFKRPQEHLLPAKFQRAVEQTCAWSNLVKVSTTTSCEGAKEMLCLIDSSYTQLHLFEDDSSTKV